MLYISCTPGAGLPWGYLGGRCVRAGPGGRRRPPGSNTPVVGIPSYQLLYLDSLSQACYIISPSGSEGIPPPPDIATSLCPVNWGQSLKLFIICYTTLDECEISFPKGEVYCKDIRRYGGLYLVIPEHILVPPDKKKKILLLLPAGRH